MVSNDKVTDIFFDIDGFCNVFEPAFTQRLLEDGKKHRNRPFRMSRGEIITIMVIFQLSGHRTFKHFYLFYLQKHMKAEFPDTVSYNRFAELMQANMPPLVLLMKTRCLESARGSDKGYISKDLAALLFDDGLHLVTRIRSNMKTC